MEILDIKDRDDGSAIISFELNEEEKNALIRMGILTAIIDGVKMVHDAKIEEIKRLNEEAQ